MMEDKVDITPLSRIIIDIIRISRKKAGVSILQDDQDIIELALITVINCYNAALQPGAGMALNLATGMNFAANKVEFEERLIVLLRNQMNE